MSQQNANVIVAIELNGGNDGLNTVIPIGDYSKYLQARGSIAIPESKILQLNDQFGLHPSMKGLQNLFNEGRLGIINNVGVVNPDFSHFRAADIWSTASDSDVYSLTGWIGGKIENEPATAHPKAVKVGAVSPLAFQGSKIAQGITIRSATDIYDWDDNFSTSDDIAFGRLAHIQRVRMKTEGYMKYISEAYSRTINMTDYPDTPLAAQLQVVARLISGHLETQIYIVTMNDFDTHAGQVNSADPSSGKHAMLLQQVDQAIKAFMADLTLHNAADHVMGVTFSEFGRTVKPNGNFGTDHGHGAPLFYFGNKLSSARIHGNMPSLNVDVVPVEYDFRKVYNEMLRWIGRDPLQGVFLGGDLPLMNTAPGKKLIKTIRFFDDQTYEEI